MLTVKTAIEVSVSGIFKDLNHANLFNKNIGDKLQLYPFRTTLDFGQLKKLLFGPDGDGTYLEKCCGEGNVQIEISPQPLFIVHGFVGRSLNRKHINEMYPLWSGKHFDERKVYKVNDLLNLEEIEKQAILPHGIVMVRNFGEVTSENLKRFKELYYEACVQVLPDYFSKHKKGTLCI